MDTMLNWCFMFTIHHLKEGIVVFLLFIITIALIASLGNKYKYSSWYEMSCFLDRFATRLLICNGIALVGVTIWVIIAGIQFFNS